MAETIIKFYLSCPAGESLWSPNGIALILQGAKPVRLAAGAFLLCVQKEPKYAWGCALKTRSPCCAESVLHADGLQKCLRRIFIAAALERRTANHHPCPLLKGGGLRRKLSRYFWE